MSIIGKIKKQPSEKRYYDIDLSADLLPGDAASTCTPTVACTTTPSNTSLAVSVTTVSATAIRLFVEEGTDQEDYKVTTKTTTLLGEVLEDEVLVVVVEV